MPAPKRTPLIACRVFRMEGWVAHSAADLFGDGSGSQSSGASAAHRANPVKLGKPGTSGINLAG